MSVVSIFHNPACGTSRNTLALIRHAGIHPIVVEYLKVPPSREKLKALIAAMGIPVRAVLREKGTPYAELNLGDPKWSDEQLLDFMLQHPNPDQSAHRGNAVRHPAVVALRKPSWRFFRRASCRPSPKTTAKSIHDSGERLA